MTHTDERDRLGEDEDYLKQAVENMTDDPAIIDSLGRVHYRMGNSDKAKSLLRTAMSKLEDAEITAHLGEVLWDKGKQQEARGIWQKALEKSPDDPTLLKVMQRFIP